VAPTQRTSRQASDDRFHDECGVFGVFDHPEAAHLTYLGLHGLQHRGQESAGIVSSGGDHLHEEKAMGQVARIFNKRMLRRLRGELAIGHVRYSTAGNSSLENAQPFLIDSFKGQIGLAHNGNLVNAQAIRESLEKEGSIFRTSSDTEVILHLIARSKMQPGKRKGCWRKLEMTWRFGCWNSMPPWCGKIRMNASKCGRRMSQ